MEEYSRSLIVIPGLCALALLLVYVAGWVSRVYTRRIHATQKENNPAITIDGHRFQGRIVGDEVVIDNEVFELIDGEDLSIEHLDLDPSIVLVKCVDFSFKIRQYSESHKKLLQTNPFEFKLVIKIKDMVF